MTTVTPGLKIVELTAENVKRIRAVSIRPAGNLVEITGRNGQGKSSILDSIWWALAGTSHIQAMPIRKGATEARIRLDLGDIKITRTFSKKDDAAEYTTKIVVENEEGARFPSPQTMLDRLVGELSFDPLAFARMDPLEQFDALKRFVPGVDFAAIEKANKADFEARTIANRRAKELRTQIAGIVMPSGAPGQRIDDAALVAQLEEAGAHNTDLERRKARREQAALDIAAAENAAKLDRQRAADLRDAAAKLERQAGEQDAHVAELRRKLVEAPALPLPIDTAQVRESIGAARVANDLFDRASRAGVEMGRLDALAVEAETASAALTAAMDQRKAEKQAAIAAAKMPVDGLSFGDGEILLNDIPFEQGSDAERLRASIAIAMASNPKLRVIRVRDGSLLDDEAMNLLAEMAQDRDYQVWIERVGGDGKVGFVIEDGSIKQGALELEAAE